MCISPKDFERLKTAIEFEGSINWKPKTEGLDYLITIVAMIGGRKIWWTSSITYAVTYAKRKEFKEGIKIIIKATVLNIKGKEYYGSISDYLMVGNKVKVILVELWNYWTSEPSRVSNVEIYEILDNKQLFTPITLGNLLYRKSIDLEVVNNKATDTSI